MEMLKSRLLDFIKATGLSVRAFEKKAGLSNGYIMRVKEGFNAQKITDILRAFPNLNPNWLLTGEGSMLKDVDCLDGSINVDASQADLLAALKKAQEQIDRLLGIIERMQSL